MSGAWVPLKKVVVQWMGQVEVDFSCSIVLRPFIGPSDYGLCPLKLHLDTPAEEMQQEPQKRPKTQKGRDQATSRQANWQ